MRPFKYPKSAYIAARSLLQYNKEVPNKIIKIIKKDSSYTASFINRLIVYKKKIPKNLWNKFKQYMKHDPKYSRETFYTRLVFGAMQKHYNEQQIKDVLKINPEFIEYFM